MCSSLRIEACVGIKRGYDSMNLARTWRNYHRADGRDCHGGADSRSSVLGMSKRMLVFHIGSLGDTLVTVPSLWVIRTHFPDAHITMLTDEQVGRRCVQAKGILDGSGLIDDYITYPVDPSLKGRLLFPLRVSRLAFSILARRFDALAYLIRADGPSYRLRRDVLFFGCAGIKRFLGTEGAFVRPARQPGSPLPRFRHAADSLLARLRASGLRVPPVGRGRFDVNIKDRERDAVNRWLLKLPSDGGRKWIGLGLGSKMPCKIWPFKSYLSVTQRLIEEYDVWPVLFGGTEDSELSQEMVLRLERGYVAAGQLSIRESIAAMERCALYLGNDTGTMHMAVAAGVRCVAMFSSRDYAGKWDPYGEGHIVLRTPVPCERCMLEECIERRMQCIRSITVQQVLQACRKILRHPAAGPHHPLLRFPAPVEGAARPRIG